jgi:hypothetical protein
VSDPAGPVFNPGGGDAELMMPADVAGFSSPLSAFSYGLSIMPTVDYDDEDSFYSNVDEGLVITIRWLNDFEAENTYDDGRQLIITSGGWYLREWITDGSGWQSELKRVPILTEDATFAIEAAMNPSADNVFLTPQDADSRYEPQA